MLLLTGPGSIWACGRWLVLRTVTMCEVFPAPHWHSRIASAEVGGETLEDPEMS